MVKAIAIIGMRLLALNWMFQGLNMFLILTLEQQEENLFSQIYYGTYFFSGLLVWFLAPLLSKFFYVGVESTPTNVKSEEFVSVGSFLIGLYIFVTRIGGLIYQLNSFSETTYDLGSIVMMVIQPIIVVIFSLFLIFGHRRFSANLFSFIRRADTKVYKVED